MPRPVALKIIAAGQVGALGSVCLRAAGPLVLANAAVFLVLPVFAPLALTAPLAPLLLAAFGSGVGLEVFAQLEHRHAATHGRRPACPACTPTTRSASTA